MRLEGRSAIVTGAGCGIGRAIALGFAAEGASVVSADIIAERARSTAEEIVAGGGRARAVTADVSKRDQVHAMVEAAVGEFGRVDILAAVAGMATVTLTGQFLCGQEAARRMVQTGGGAIINITSQVAEVAQPMSAHYQASKGGAKMLTKSMALDLIPHGIRVNALA